MNTLRRTPTIATRPVLLLLLLLASCSALVAGCIDTGPPAWWDYDETSDAVAGGLIEPVGELDCTDADRAAPPDSLRLHFIDVGQGDAIWIQTPTGENILVDAGDGGYFGRTSGGPIVERYLTEHGFAPGAIFDAIVVSHAHSDHYGGLQHLFGRYGVARFIDPGLDSTATSYGNVVSAARARVEARDFHRPAVSGSNGLVTTYGQSTNLFGSEVAAWVLHADSVTRYGTSDNARVNNTSVVLKLVYAGRHILLTGDIHAEVELELRQRFGASTEEPTLKAHLLKVAHHGSATSSTILDSHFNDIPQNERYAVIQAGRMRFGSEDATLPAAETVFRLWSYMPQENLFSTESGDASKTEAEAVNDDHVLAVIRRDGTMRVCYNRVQ